MAKTTIADLKKQIAKLEKEVKKHQNSIDKLSHRLWFYNPLVFHSFKPKIKIEKSSLPARLKGKKS